MSVLPAGLAGELGERVLHVPGDLVVVPALGDLPLHVRVLVLDHAGHHRVGRVHEVDQLLLGVADELLHELGLGQPHGLDGVGGEEAVLDVEDGRGRCLGDAASDEAEVAGFLGVAGEDHAPAAVGHAHHVVVAGVDVQALARERRAPMFITTGSRLPEMV